MGDQNLSDLQYESEIQAMVNAGKVVELSAFTARQVRSMQKVCLSRCDLHTKRFEFNESDIAEIKKLLPSKKLTILTSAGAGSTVSLIVLIIYALFKLAGWV